MLSNIISTMVLTTRVSIRTIRTMVLILGVFSYILRWVFEIGEYIFRADVSNVLFLINNNLSMEGVLCEVVLYLKHVKLLLYKNLVKWKYKVF